MWIDYLAALSHRKEEFDRTCVFSYSHRRRRYILRDCVKEFYPTKCRIIRKKLGDARVSIRVTSLPNKFNFGKTVSGFNFRERC